MKKLLYLAVGFLAVFACSRETVDPVHPENPSVDTTEPIQVTLTTGSVETRTELRLGEGNRLHPFWTSEDDINVIRIPESIDDFESDEDGDPIYPENHFEITLLDNGARADFTGTVPSAGDYLAFYPQAVLGESEDGYSYLESGAYSYIYWGEDYIEGYVSFEVPSVQRPSSTSFDPAADLLISTPFEIATTQPTTVGTSFTRMNAIVKLVLVNQTGIEGFDSQKVRRVSIGTSAGGDGEGGYYGAPVQRNRTSGRTRASVYDSDEDGEHYYSDRGLAGRVEYRFGKRDGDFWDVYDCEDAWSRSVTAEYDASSAYTIGDAGVDETATYLIVVPGILKNDECEYDGDFDGLHICVETDGYVIERNVKLPSGGIALQPSSVTTLQIGLYPDGNHETNIMDKGFSFMHWVEGEETPVSFSSLSVKEDSYEDFWVSLAGLTLDKYEWQNELQVSCEPSGFVWVNLDDVYYDYYSNELCYLEVWGKQVTNSPVTVTFSAGGVSSSFEVNVVKANTPASISLGAGVSRIDLDQYDPLSLNATITPDDPTKPLNVNYDHFACKLIDPVTGSESLINGVTFVESGSDPSEMVITLPAISEAGEFNLEITYKEASLLTIPFKVWAGAALPEALQNWHGPSRSDYWYAPSDKSKWFDDYKNQEGGLKTYFASLAQEIPNYAFAGAFRESSSGDFEAFKYFTGLSEVPEYAFYDCQHLTGITLPVNITSIAQSAFENSTALTSIQLPGPITEIGNNVFKSSGIGSINLPEGLKSIGESAFWGCHGLLAISIPGSIETLGDNAFMYTGLTSVSFSPNINQLTNLPLQVFYGTEHLTSISIPQSVEVIGESAFSNSGLEIVVIPEGVMEVGESAFAYTQLTTVTLPSSVTSIGEYAFSNCPMTSANLLPVNPPTVWGNAFRPDAENGYFKYPIFVPSGSLSLYVSAAANWIEAAGSFDTSRIQSMP